MEDVSEFFFEVEGDHRDLHGLTHSFRTRRASDLVAASVGQTPALVHYDFPATDELLLAVDRRAAERNLERVNQALASPQPLAALWALSTDPARTVLAAEFMDLEIGRA